MPTSDPITAPSTAAPPSERTSAGDWADRVVYLVRDALPHGRPLPDDLWRTRHRGILALLWMHVLAVNAFGLALGHESVAHILAESAIVAVLAALATWSHRSRATQATLASLGLIVSSGLLVHYSGGYIELHFHFFVMIAVITLYQQWRPFLVAIGFVVLHHGLLGSLDPQSVYNHIDAWEHPWKWAAIHGTFVLAASAAGVFAWRLNEVARDHSELLLNSVGEGVFGLNAQGIITFVNPVAIRMSDARAEDLIGRSLHDVMMHGSPQGTLYPGGECPVCQAVAAGALPATTEGVLIQRDGSKLPVEYAGTPIRERDRQIGSVITCKDISERKAVEAALAQSEDQLRQAQKMEAVGRLAGGVAHDFNNLLTGINGFSELILLRMTPDDPNREYLDQVLASGERARVLVSQLLAFSRRQPLNAVVLDLNTVVSDMKMLLERVLGEDVELRTALDPDPELVEADPGQMEQIILNLAVNARDAMPGGGRLSIQTGNVEFVAGEMGQHLTLEPGHYTLLEVSDTGQGMDAETRAHIFEPFFTTKGPGRGTGLGLSTVYGIVKQSGGDVWAYSEPGHGTTFKIYLPQAKAAPRVRKAEVVPTSLPRGSETILLVEDEAAVRTLTTTLLESLGYTVRVARGGEEATRIAAESPDPIHLVLTDMVMPGMGGREVADRLTARDPSLRVVYMSGFSNDIGIGQRALGEGVQLLQKPFTLMTLAHRVRQTLDEPIPMTGLSSA